MLSTIPVEGMSDLTIRLAVSAALLLLVTAHSVRCTGDTCYNGGGVQDVSLAPGQSITSRNGRVMLVLQTDGDLVVKCTDTWYGHVVRRLGGQVYGHVVRTRGTDTWYGDLVRTRGTETWWSSVRRLGDLSGTPVLEGDM